MNNIISWLKHNVYILLAAAVFFVIGLLEIFKPEVRPSGRWQIITGPLWDSFGNLGLSFFTWALGGIVVIGLIFRRK